MISVDDLLYLVLADLKPLPPIYGYLRDAYGQVLAEDLIAVKSLPWYANAAMDGFAVRRADLTAFNSIAIVDDVAAGGLRRETVGHGQGVSIATGAPIPRGLDTVVPLEEADYSAGRITVRGRIPLHGHVRPAGEDVAAGRSMALSGTLVTDAIIMLGHATGAVMARFQPEVRVQLLTLGDELTYLGADPSPNHVQNFNSELLMTPIAKCGCSPATAECPDLAPDIATKLVDGEYDIVVTTGGLGPGKHDLLLDAVASVGTVDSFEVAMRPGKAFAIGHVGEKQVYALPGNPGAALAMFHALVAPALRVIAGRPPHPPTIQAVLTHHLDNSGGRRHYVRATLAWDGPTLAATPTGRQGSGLVSDIVAADAFLVIPETVERAKPGDVYQIIPLKPIGGSS